MKNKNLGKAAGISLILGLMLTGCSNPEPAPTNTAPAATASASASAKPGVEPSKTAKPVETELEEAKRIEAELAKHPLGFDIDELIAKEATPEYREGMGKKEAAKAVHAGLTIYQDVISSAELYNAREDAADDFENLIMTSDMADAKFDGSLLETMRTEADANGFLGAVPAANGDGILGRATDKSGKEFDVKAVNADAKNPYVPINEFTINNITYDANGDTYVAGTRNILFNTSKGVVEFKTTFSFNVTKVDNDYKLIGLSWGFEDIGKVISDD